MSSQGPIESDSPKENPFTGKDVLQILRRHGWLSADPALDHLAFCDRAAALLGPHVNDAAALGDLLRLIFHYDAEEILQTTETHAVLARYGARDVVRQLSLFLLDPAPFDSDRFKELVTLLKEKLELRGRDLFHPLRLVLAGRAGEGDLDRVILLLEEGSTLGFALPVKSARTRCLEFCATLN
jgi:nondiscriminating glutamyl-tRNA synthetase